MIDFADELAIILSGPLGRDATYTPEGGSPVSVRAVPRSLEDLVEFEDIRAVVGVSAFTVSQNEIASRPRSGAALVVSGVTYIVTDDAIEDARGRTWTLVARRT